MTTLNQEKLQQWLAPVLAFLPCRTPESWLQKAMQNQDILLIDHAHCEKKAAATALHLMHRYLEYPDLLNKMSRLAREELRHFEQVLKILQERGIGYRHLTASRYAAGLRDHANAADPQRLVDILIIGALIEARSCERFYSLLPLLDDTLTKFYYSLLRSESRHFQDYLTLAENIAAGPITERVEFFCAIEQDLILSPDENFHFHSGA